MWHSILDFFGVIDEGGKGYGFFSGVGSDIGELAIIGGLISIYRKHTCHIDGCWRIAKHPVEGTPYVACRKHHPAIDENVKLTPERLQVAHELGKANR